jgi:signal transduction histidine kinase/CheY-like chemotaxis protein
MRARFASEIKIIVFALVVLVCVAGISGILAYRNIFSLVDSSGKNNSEQKLVALKEIATDLSDADNSVHSYNLVKDEEYLLPFYTAATSIDEKLDHLYQWSTGDPRQSRSIDTLVTLVETRFNILRDFLTLDDDQRIVQSLQQIADKLEQKKDPVKQLNTASASVEDTVKKKSNIIRKIFGRKDKEGNEQPINSDPVVKEKVVDVKEVKGTLVKVKQDQLKKLQENKERELSYTKLDKEVNDKITALITDLEKQELDRNTAQALATNEKIRDTDRSIAVACALFVLLLLLVSFVILRYARRSRNYTVALNKAKTEAEELARMKENFLASMSHEMRTPMNAIAGFTEQLQQTTLDKEQKRQLEIIRDSTEHLVEILNDVLDYSKLQAGKIKLQPVSFRVAKLLKEITQLVTPVAEKKQLLLSHSVSAKVPEVIRCDELRLKQILLNLAGNAVKFTEKGEVKLEADLKTEQGCHHLVVRVSDTGIGIPGNKLEKIFEEFEQADEGITKKYGGTGLGLSITKKLVELQQGYIEIESEPGKGTVITITIPCVPASLHDIDERPEVKTDTTLLKGRKILVVDDEAYNRLLLIAILKKWGVTYQEASNGIEAIEQLTAGEFDAVLMDVRMPVMDGLETIRRTRKLEISRASIPAIAVTAAASVQDAARCKEAGFDEVISKPFREMELYHKLAGVMNIEGTGELLEEKIVVKESGKTYDLGELKRLAGDDDKFFVDMIRTFIDSTAEGVASIVKYAAEKNWEQTGHYAHKIAAPCRHMGANELLLLLQKIESISLKKKEGVEEIPRLAEKVKEGSEILLKQLELELEKAKV